MLDILGERIEIKDISAVVSTTAFASINECMEELYLNYWQQHDKTKVHKTLVELWPLICQPRLQIGLANHKGHYSNIYWVDTKEEKFIKLT